MMPAHRRQSSMRSSLIAATAMLAQAAAVQPDAEGLANDGKLTEMHFQPTGNYHGPMCVKWAEFKLPCSGSEWWVTTLTHHYKDIRVVPQLISGNAVTHGITAGEAYAAMHNALDADHRDWNIDYNSEKTQGQCAYGWATNPLCVPASAWKRTGVELARVGAKTVLWKRTNLAKWASSIMFKGNETGKCHSHNIGKGTSQKEIKACTEDHIAFPPALYLNVITMVACQSDLQERIMAVASPHAEPVRAYYEAMQLDPEGEPERVLKAVGLDNMEKAKVEEDVKMKKSSESLRDKVDNYDEIAKYLQGWDSKVEHTGCSLHAMFVSTEPKLWKECSASKLCPALHGMQKLDWAQDRPPPTPWDYIKSIKKGWDGDETWYKSGSFKDYYEWTDVAPSDRFSTVAPEAKP